MNTGIRRLLAFASIAVGIPTATIGQSSPQDSLQRLIDEHTEQNDRRAELLNELSYQLQFSDPEKGLSLAQEVIDFGNKLTDTELLYTAYLEKAHNLLQLGQYPETLENARKALEGFQTTGSKVDIAFACSTIGIAFNHLNNYPRALDNLQQAAKILREEQHPQESTLYLNMARIYGERKHYDKALEYLNQANAKAIETGNRLLQTYGVFNMAMLKLETNEPSEGRVLLDSALVLAQSVNDQMMVGRIYGSIGKSYNELKQFDSAEHYLRLAIDFNAQIGNERSRALALKSLSETYQHTGKMELAYRYAIASYAAGEALGMIDLQQSASELLGTYHEKNNRLDSALFYHKLEVALTDSLANEKNQAELTRLELQYDFDLKEQEYIQQQALSKLRYRQLWLAGLLVVICISAAMGILFYRNRLRTIRLQNEMREKELTQQAESLVLQQQLTESELKAIRSQMNPHFIFNVLNSIESYIVEHDAKTASKLIQRFSKLSRLVLENSTQSLVTADREVEAVRLYLALEAERFEQRFAYETAVSPSLNLSETLIPPMLIQPLAENAILHGFRNLSGRQGNLHIALDKEDDQLMVTVTDDGIGLAAAKQQHQVPDYKKRSLGIESIRERLVLLATSFPDTSTPQLTITEITTPGKSGTVVRLVIPYLHTAHSDTYLQVNPLDD